MLTSPQVPQAFMLGSAAVNLSVIAGLTATMATLRILDEQTRLFLSPAKKRRTHAERPEGAELTDHYGHRHGDVDVEHI
ncbi:hypothetical protein [Magnetospira sp. QH-2]|uniref:hypothetical protein n=1 Tax=Magnetospira sp. (strain QH-2) TaxID=1288970 RepID=UPI0003E81102|nr:hypothetical protein [Magnetospira sp. QH-2]CCQ72002.1 protein of unknown function [Magnetospira sp. QH-2]